MDSVLQAESGKRTRLPGRKASARDESRSAPGRLIYLTQEAT